MSDVPSRREVRRRKILENSTSRLQKIANVNRENVVQSNDRPHDVGSTENDVRNHLVDDDEGDDELTMLFERQATTSNTTSSVNVAFNTDRQRLYLLFFLALLMKLMSYVCTPDKILIPLTQLDVKTVCVDSIFVPVFIYEIASLVLHRNFDAEYSFIHLLLVLGNLSLKTATVISYLLNVLIRVTQDLLAYFFLFTAMDLFVHVAQNVQVCLHENFVN